VNSVQGRLHRIQWNPELLDLVLEQKQAYDQWKKGGEEGAIGYQNLKVISRIKRRKLRKMEREEDLRKSKEVEALRSTNPKEFWRKIKGTGGQRHKLPSCIKSEQGLIVQGEDALNEWQKSFQKLLQRLEGEDSFDSEHRREIENCVERIAKEKEAKNDGIGKLNRPLELAEVSRAIKKVRRNKASGLMDYQSK